MEVSDAMSYFDFVIKCIYVYSYHFLYKDISRILSDIVPFEYVRGLLRIYEGI